MSVQDLHILSLKKESQGQNLMVSNKHDDCQANLFAFCRFSE